MKQTAVDWLVQELSKKGDYGLGFYLEHKDEIIQAKEMEKEQMIDFSKVVLKEYKRIRPEDISTIKRLYNETFKSNEK